jgi:hypothetical protein
MTQLAEMPEESPMPTSLPDAATLLKAAIRYLEEELLPELSGYHRFKIRVTANVLATIKRELELQADHEVVESDRLGALLGHQDDLPELNRELTEKIKAGAIALDNAELLRHIHESLREALAINNPKWITE